VLQNQWPELHYMCACLGSEKACMYCTSSTSTTPTRSIQSTSCNSGAPSPTFQKQMTTHGTSRLQVAILQPDYPAYLVVLEQDVDTGSEQSTDIVSSQSTAMPDDTKKRGRGRPCKGKRSRYQKFVRGLKEKIVENPDTFDIQSVVLLPSLLLHAERREKLLSMIEDFQREVKLNKIGKSFSDAAALMNNTHNNQ